MDLGTFADRHNQNLLRRAFTDPESLKPGRTRASFTQDAAQQFSRIAIGMHSPAPNRSASCEAASGKHRNWFTTWRASLRIPEFAT